MSPSPGWGYKHVVKPVSRAGSWKVLVLPDARLVVNLTLQDYPGALRWVLLPFERQRFEEGAGEGRRSRASGQPEPRQGVHPGEGCPAHSQCRNLGPDPLSLSPSPLVLQMRLQRTEADPNRRVLTRLGCRCLYLAPRADAHGRCPRPPREATTAP